MAILALDVSSTEPYVSDLDPDKNAVLLNEADIEAWKKSKAQDKGEQPEPVYGHGPKATIWKIGALDGICMANLSDDLTSVGQGGNLVLRNAHSDVLAARLALKGWENFKIGGKDVEFATETINLNGYKYEAVTEEVAGLIPLPVMREIGRKAKESNTVSGVQEKNSA